MRRRRLLYGILITIGVLGALGVGLKLYLGSDRVARQAAERLQAIYGAPVRAGRLDAGLWSTDLHAVELFEAGPNAPAAPWVVIPRVKTDISLWDLLVGSAAPEHLTLASPKVALRFASDGRMLTQLPRRPEKPTGPGVGFIHIESGTLKLSQDGRPELVVTDINGDLRAEGNRLAVTGTAQESRWGQATLGGWVEPPSGAWLVTVQVPPTAVTPAMLGDLPFVGPEVWREVRADGTLAGTLTLRFDPERDRVHYRVEFEAQKTKLYVAAIDLHTDDTTGRVVVEDGLVELDKVTGQSAGGTIVTKGTLDFRREPNRLTFEVAVTKLRLRSLPKKWFQSGAVQQLFDGRLTGSADLQVTIDAQGALTQGKGLGIIREATFAGVPAEPIRLTLRADGKAFRISVPPPGGNGKEPQGAAAPLPAQLVNETSAILAHAAAGLTSVPEAARAAVAGTPSTLTIDLGLDNADLGELLRNLDVQAPMAVHGRVTCRGRVVIPLDTPGDFHNYRFQGTGELTGLCFERFRMEHVRARLDYRDGVLRVSGIDGRVLDATSAAGPTLAGAFHGTARLELFPAGALTAWLSFADVPVSQVARLVATADLSCDGACSGTAFVHGSLKRWSDATAWEGSAQVYSPQFRVADWEVEDLVGRFRLTQGVLVGEEVAGKLSGAAFHGQGQLRLDAPFSYHAAAELTADDPATCDRLTCSLGQRVTLSQSVHVRGDVAGTLRPAQFTVAGTAAAAAVAIDGLKLADVSLHWAQREDALRLTEIHARLYGGTASGEARLPQQGDGIVDFLFCGVDVAALAQERGVLGVRLRGSAAGACRCTLTPAGAVVRVDVQSRNLRVEGVQAERLAGSVLVDPAGADYRFTGLLLGGPFSLNGYLPSDVNSDQAQGRLRLERARLSRLWTALGAGAFLDAFRGGLALELNYQHEGPNRMPVGRGRFILNRLRWGDATLAETVVGQLQVAGSEVRVRELTGNLGQGALRGSVFYDVAQADRSRFNIALENVEADRLLGPWPALAEQVSGTLDMQVRGRMGGAEWRGSGDAVLARGTVGGVDVVNWRLPFEFTCVPQDSRGRVEVRETQAQISQGQATGRASLAWGAGARSEGSLRFFNVGLRSLLRSLNTSGPVGAGQLSGRLDFATDNLADTNSYTATLDASLQQAQAMQLPVLRQLTPFLMPGQSGSAIFQTGAAQARLSRSIIRVQRLQLEGPILQLIVQGTATLEGRLNLEAIANTGGLAANAPFLRQLSADMGDGPLPLALLGQATRLLSIRLVRLRIAGTASLPIVERDTIVSLTEEAVRFFVGWAGRR